MVSKYWLKPMDWIQFFKCQKLDKFHFWYFWNCQKKTFWHFQKYQNWDFTNVWHLKYWIQPISYLKSSQCWINYYPNFNILPFSYSQMDQRRNQIQGWILYCHWWFDVTFGQCYNGRWRQIFLHSYFL